MAIDDVAYYGVEDGITQKLQAFVVLWATFLVTTSYTLVQEGLLVEFDVVRIEAQNTVEGRKKLLLLAERELDTVNDIVNPHTS